MKKWWWFIAVLFPLLSFSQGKTEKTRFQAITSAGLIAGESTAKPLFQLSSGLKYGRWFTGIGSGLDLYKFSSIPLFADGRVSFGKNGLTFLYAHGGYNIPTGGLMSERDNFSKTKDRFYGGIYLDAGIGYRVPTKNPLHRILFSAGYSQKNLKNTVVYVYPCLNPPCFEEVYNYYYHLGRIVAKISWEFGR